MPSYISHAIHSEELYKELNMENLLEENIKLYRLRGYSIAYDYAFLVPVCTKHAEKMARDGMTIKISITIQP